MTTSPSRVAVRIPAIHCQACVRKIEDIVSALHGTVEDSDTSTTTVTLAYDPARASLTDIERALAEQGFPVAERVDGESRSVRRIRPLPWVLLAVGLAGVLAWGGYYAGFQGFVYGVSLPNAFDRLGVLTVSVIAGTAAFFSPCGFPLLPAYASYYLMRDASAEEARASHQLARSLRSGAVAAAGLTVVNVAIGAIIVAVGASSPFEGDPRRESWVILAIRFVAGLVIAVMGLRVLIGRHRGTGLLARLGARFGQLHGDGRHSASGFFWYGLTYNAASIGCTGPILLGLMLFYALVSERALAAFAIFTVTMAALMVLTTVVVGTTARVPVLRLREATPVIQRVGAVMLITLGTYTMIIQSFGAGREFFVKVFLPFLLSTLP